MGQRLPFRRFREAFQNVPQGPTGILEDRKDAESELSVACNGPAMAGTPRLTNIRH